MRILITNDDGFGHVGHQSLRAMLLQQGHEVWSIAPMCNQSGVGMKITLGKAVRFEQLDEQAWSCSGTPVDCVSFALHGMLPFRPDAVISGINAGANLSDDLWYSGTAAAAREASKLGIPALALSYSPHIQDYTKEDFATFGLLLQQHLPALLAACELEEATQVVVPKGERSEKTLEKKTERTPEKKQYGFLNINIPGNCSGKIFLARKFEGRGYSNKLQCIAENEYTLLGSLDPSLESSVGVDTFADRNFYASISFNAFQALQPLSYQLASNAEASATLSLRATGKAREAIAQVLQSGISL